jgi:hypothetical protein
LNSNSQYETIGYLHKDDDQLRVENVKGESAIWKFTSDVDGSANSYVITQGTDTLAFAPPTTTVTDTIATLLNGSRLNRWDGLVFNFGERNSFRSSYMDEALSVHSFNLRLTEDDVVMLSAENSAIYNLIYFTLERVTDAPKPNSLYKILIDSIDVLNVVPADTTFLGIDTIPLLPPPFRIDSLVTIGATITDIDTAFFWRFAVDTVINDSTYYKIYNALTDSILAFDVPRYDTIGAQFVDTVAYMQQTGTLNSWLMPCFKELGGKNAFIVKDPQSKTNFFLSLNPSGQLILVSDTIQYKYLKFKFIEQGFVPEPPDVGDSRKVFRVQYVGLGAHDQQYIGANLQGDTVWSYDVYGHDTVYAHLPDFQFVISLNDKYELINRLDSTIRTGTLTAVIDTSVNPHRPIDHQFTNGIDTFVITAIDYGNMNNLKKDAQLGFKAFSESQLAANGVIFTAYSADTLAGRNLGYNVEEDSLFSLLTEADSVRFILTPAATPSRGAAAIAAIKQLQREAYLLSVLGDEVLHLSKGDTLLSVGQPGAVLSDTSEAVVFFLKEDTTRGTYYFVDTVAGHKLLIDTLSKQLYFAPADTAVNHTFTFTLRPKVVLEPDEYTYLTELPNGAGKYEVAYLRSTNDWRWLTKNDYDRAVLRKEGESMLRAGSFTPADFSLWMDTARGTGFNPEKPSFYIVKDAAVAETNPVTVSGYFLHVMDSTSLPVHDDDVVVVDGIEYNRLNFVKASKRAEPNGLVLETGAPPTWRDSIGYAGKNETAINEYRFFLQKVDSVAPDGKGDSLYYIVTESGYGSPEGNRGYLSIKRDDYKDDTLYVGPRNDHACLVTIKWVSPTATANPVVVIPQAKEEKVSREVVVIGGKGSISILNAMGQQATVYNIIGVKVADKQLATDGETLAAPRGISIVRVGMRTQKVVVL